MDRRIRPGRRPAQTALWLLVLGGVLLLPGCSSPSFPELEEEPSHPVGVTEKETRFFSIAVDGKKAGQNRMAIIHHPDGTLTMTSKAKVRISIVIYTYTYTYEGTETYQKGRLTHFQSHADDNGKKFEVSARARGDKLHLVIGDKERLISAAAWLTSYWQLPANLSPDGAVILLDGDTGRVMEGRLRHIGDGPLTVAGKELPCAHYRLTGAPSSPVDLWYDGRQRLVREEFVEDGHRTVLQMTRSICRETKEALVPKTAKGAAAR